jgi:hypothetical protein
MSGPFLHERDGHFAISYACATYLSTSHCLISHQCSEEEQVLRVAKGFHGLHLYAHEFLIKHVLRYAELQCHSKSAFSETLSTQLQRLDLFHKRDLSVGFKAALRNHRCLQDIMPRLSNLQLPPKLHGLIRDILVFQEMSTVQDNHHQTEPQGEYSQAAVECWAKVLKGRLLITVQRFNDWQSRTTQHFSVKYCINTMASPSFS